MIYSFVATSIRTTQYVFSGCTWISGSREAGSPFLKRNIVYYFIYCYIQFHTFDSKWYLMLSAYYAQILVFLLMFNFSIHVLWSVAIPSGFLFKAQNLESLAFQQYFYDWHIHYFYNWQLTSLNCILQKMVSYLFWRRGPEDGGEQSIKGITKLRMPKAMV